MNMPEGWNKFVASYRLGSGVPVDIAWTKFEEASKLMKEMAEALENNIKAFDHHCSGDLTAPTDSAWIYSEKVLNKFKEWK